MSISLFIKKPNENTIRKIYHSELWGSQDEKYQILSMTDISTTKWLELRPSSPYYFFMPKDFTLQAEYDQFWHLPQIFQTYATGVGTGRDEAFVRFDRNQVIQLASDLSNPSMQDDDIKEKYGIQDTSGWNFTFKRKNLIHAGFKTQDIIQYHYRPFDVRFAFYNQIMRRDQKRSMKHLVMGNLALLTCQQQSSLGFNHVLCTHWVVDESVISNRTRERSLVFPLYLYPDENQLQLETVRRPNLNPEFIKAFTEKLGLKFIEDGNGDLNDTFGPEDVFNYAYAIFHSPTYRIRYAEFLKIDFPRLPLTSNKALFKALTEKGAELVALHLMESPMLNILITEYPVTGSNAIDKVSYDDNNQRVYISKTQYFEGVPLEVWEFHIGGYQVAEKWLKDRKGRTLTYDELTHYQKIVVALKETIRLMEEIDGLITQWPIE